MRVYELAKIIGTESKVLRVHLERLGYTVKSPSSRVDLLPIEQEALIGWMQAHLSHP